MDVVLNLRELMTLYVLDHLKMQEEVGGHLE